MDKNIPDHIALIPDGNRRWARKRRLQPWLGHERGLSGFDEVVKAAFAAGSRFVTFWGASRDNLTKRSRIEVRFLLQYIRRGLAKKSTREYFVKEKINVRVLGEWDRILSDAGLRKAVRELEEQTRNFGGRFLTILFGYDGKSEMLAAIRALIKQKPSGLSYDSVRKKLWTGHLPPVDLVIRTGGEPHWSAGFMMWLCADSQFYFTETLWPDFDKKRLAEAFAEYSSRGRRFGK